MTATPLLSSGRVPCARSKATAAFITRPEPEASQWAAALAELGLPATAFALIEIGAAPDPAQLRAAQLRSSDYRAIMVVSGNAARHFFDSNEALALTEKGPAAIKTRVWSPGPGTAAVLRACGISADQIDQPDAQSAQFDSESLWQQVGPSIRPGDRVLIVRGSEAHADPASASTGSGRDWLSAQIRSAGGQIDYIAAYTRAAPAFTSAQLAAARSASDTGACWVLSSAQALGHLLAALPEQRWSDARALATHPRIAEAAHRAGFGAVVQCRPALEDVAAALASIESCA